MCLNVLNFHLKKQTLYNVFQTQLIQKFVNSLRNNYKFSIIGDPQLELLEKD